MPITFTKNPIPGTAVLSLTGSEYDELCDSIGAPHIEQNKQNAALITNLKMQLADALKPDAPADDTAEQLAAANNRVAELVTENALLDTAYDDLHDGLMEMLKVPPGGDLFAAVKALIVPKPDTPPVVVPGEIVGGTGFTLTLDDAPGAGKDAMARELMQMGAKMGFKWTRYLRNADEVRDDLKRKTDDPRHLYAVASKLGLLVAADTIDLMAMRLTDTELKTYLAGLETLGAKLLVFNDANQYRDGKKDDGSPLYAPGTLERLVKRVRDYSKLPIMASMTVSANPGAYDLFDFLEAQTFGRIDQLDDYLAKSFDAFCLDGQASVSLDYLMKAHDVILKANPARVWYYTAKDRKTDWRNMPDKVALIEKTVQALNKQRAIQPA